MIGLMPEAARLGFAAKLVASKTGNWLFVLGACPSSETDDSTIAEIKRMHFTAHTVLSNFVTSDDRLEG
jgi:hypothetical protein